MLGIGLGAAAFLVIFWVDSSPLTRMPLVKPLLWVCGGALFVIGVAHTALSAPRLVMPPLLAALGWGLAGLFSLLLLYSLLIEIPFTTAYLGGGPSRLVTWGTYALCRHPGVLWLGGLLAGVFMASGSLLLLPAFLVWMGLDLLTVLLQERLFFGRIFGREYKDYQKEVPLLIPNAHSIRRCIRTLRGGSRWKP